MSSVQCPSKYPLELFWLLNFKLMKVSGNYLSNAI